MTTDDTTTTTPAVIAAATEPAAPAETTPAAEVPAAEPAAPLKVPAAETADPAAAVQAAPAATPATTPVPAGEPDCADAALAAETPEARDARQAAIADAMTAEAMRAPAGAALPDIRAAGQLVRHGGIVLNPFSAPYQDCWPPAEAGHRALTAGWVTEAVRAVSAHLREWNAAGRPEGGDAGYVLQNACLYPPASPATAEAAA